MIAVPFIYFSLLFIFYYVKNKQITSGLFIVLIYLLSSFMSLYGYLLDTYKGTNIFGNVKLDFIPTFLYCSLLTITIYPFLKPQNKLSIIAAPFDIKRFKYISYILICCSFISLYTVKDEILTILSGDFKSIRNEYYVNSVIVNDKNELIQQNILITILNLLGSLFPITLLFYFYSTTFYKNKFWFNLLLLLSSLTTIFLGIKTASRTQVIYWLLLYGFLYFLFKDSCPNKNRKYHNMPIAVFTVPLFLYMSMVTVSRFSDETNGVQNSLISYSGQMFINFCDVFNRYDSNEIYLQRIFPFISKYIFGNSMPVAVFRENIERASGVEIGLFYTFIGDAYVDLGTFGMIIYTLVFSLISNLFLKYNHNKFSLSALIILVMLARQPLHGIFAYVYLSINTTFYIFICIYLYNYIKSKKTPIFLKGHY